MGRPNKRKSLNVTKSNTPQSQKKGLVAKMKKTPKSEPQPKRKKLSQEIDEAISDEEFEVTTKGVKELEKLKKKQGTVTPKPASPKKVLSDGESEDSEDDDFDPDNLNLDSDEIDVSDDSEDDDSDDDDDLEDDDDDDDSEDDEEDLNDAGQGKSKLAAKFKEIMEAEGEIDSDEDEDDSEEEESEEEAPPTKKMKGKNKNAEKEKKKAQPKVLANKKDSKAQLKESNQAKKRKQEVVTNGAAVKVSKEDLAKDHSLQEDRDSRTLFVKITGEVSEVRVKKLLSDSLKKAVLDVRIQGKGRAKKGERQSNVYVEFNSKENVTAAHTHLKSQKVFVDFVGKNSKRPEKSSKKKDPENFDPLRLYITGFNRKETLQELKKVFPTAEKIQLPIRKKNKRNTGYAFAFFKTAEACKKVHNSSGLTCNGRSLTVLYANKTSMAKKSDKRPQDLEDKVTAKKAKKQETGKNESKAAKSKAVKAKVEQMEEDDDDDEEDDDDSEDDLEEEEDHDSEEEDDSEDDKNDDEDDSD